MVRVRITYLVATLALMVALPCLVGVLTPGPSAPGSWLTLGLSGALALWLLAFEARRDVFAFAQFMLVAFLFAATFAAAAYVAAESSEGRRRAVLAGAVCVAGMGWCVLRLLREHRAQGELPNWLLERFHRSALFEIEGVQWTCTQGPERLGGENWLRVFLQNAVAAERVVSIALEDVTGLGRQRGSLLVPTIASVTLRPGEVGSLYVPVAIGPRPARTTDLYISVRARGPVGRRLRPFRARAAPERTRPWLQLLALFAGHLVWGGGVRLRFHNPHRHPNLHGAPAEARWESIDLPALRSP
jgi:hypothetical protein